MSAVTIALAQMKMVDDQKTNLHKSLALLQQAAAKGADLILYPEVQLSKFFAQYPRDEHHQMKALAEDDEVFSLFQNACRQYGIAASPNFYTSLQGKPYDASFLIDSSGNMIGCQKMVHIAQAKQFYEQDYYTPSDDGFHVFDLNGIRIGIVVCFDRHYPESIRTEALQGAEVILIPTANTEAEPMELFEQEIRVQAFQNECYVLMCNRTGQEDQMLFAGESLGVNPDGSTLVKADEAEQLLFVSIDTDRVQEARRTRPYLNLRRTEWYL